MGSRTEEEKAEELAWMKEKYPHMFEPGLLHKLSGNHVGFAGLEHYCGERIVANVAGYDPRTDPCRQQHSLFAHLVDRPSRAHKLQQATQFG